MDKSNPCLFSGPLHKFLNFLYDLLYHSFAWAYDLAAAMVSFGHWNDWVRDTIPFVSGSRVLELGFGPGRLQLELIKAGYSVYGLDESPQMIRQASHRLRHFHTRTNLVRGLSQHIPFDSTFDVIVATFPSEYIFDPSTINEIHRVLVPGGKVVVLLTATVIKPAWLLEVIKKLVATRADLIESQLDRVINRYKEAGFTMEKVMTPRKYAGLLFLIGEKTENHPL